MGYEDLWTSWDESYGWWHDCIDRTEQQVEWLSSRIGSISIDPVTILDIGCGDGGEMADVRNRCERNVRLSANDISNEAISEYINANGERVINTYPCPFEELADKLDYQHHVGLFSHCLHTADIGDVLGGLEPHLSHRMLILLESTESTITSIRRRYWEDVHGTAHTENTGEDVMLYFEDEGIEYEVTPIEYHVNVHDLPDGGIKDYYIPFGMRTDEIDTDTMNSIVSFVRSQMTEHYIPQRTLAIEARLTP